MALKVLSYRNVIGTFYELLESAVTATWVNEVSAPAVESDQPDEKIAFVNAAPMLTKRVGGKTVGEEPEVKYITVVNDEYEAAIEVDRKDWDRDHTGQIEQRFADLASGTVDHWGAVMSTLIEAGTGLACYDTQWFFDTDHSEGDSGTQSNLFVYTDVPALDVVLGTLPTPGETNAAILALLPKLFSYKDAKGRPRNQGMKKVVVMVPATMIGSAVGAVTNLKVENPTGTGTRDNALLKVVNAAGDGISFEVRPNPYLTATSASRIYLFRGDGNSRAIVRTSEVEPELDLLGPGSEYWKLNKKVRASVYARRGLNLGWWFSAIQATFHTHSG